MIFLGNMLLFLALVIMIGGFMMVVIKEKMSLMYTCFIISMLLLGLGIQLLY